jgi:hypothetical protein
MTITTKLPWIHTYYISFDNEWITMNARRFLGEPKYMECTFIVKRVSFASRDFLLIRLGRQCICSTYFSKDTQMTADARDWRCLIQYGHDSVVRYCIYTNLAAAAFYRKFDHWLKCLNKIMHSAIA